MLNLLLADIARSTASLIPRNELNDDLAISNVNFNINNRVRQTSASSDDDDDDHPKRSTQNVAVTATSSAAVGCSKNEECCSRPPPQPIVLDIEDLMVRNGQSPTKASSNLTSSNDVCSPHMNCAGSTGQECHHLIQDYRGSSQNGLEPIEVEEDIDENQTMQHTVLLILLLCSMFVVCLIYFSNIVSFPIQCLLYRDSPFRYGLSLWRECPEFMWSSPSWTHC